MNKIKILDKEFELEDMVEVTTDTGDWSNSYVGYLSRHFDDTRILLKHDKKGVGHDNLIVIKEIIDIKKLVYER